MSIASANRSSNRRRLQSAQVTPLPNDVRRATLAAAIAPCFEGLERRQLLSAGDLNFGPINADVRGFQFDYRNGIATQSDGKMLVAGYVGTSGVGTGKDIAVARYNVNGSIDTSYGGGTGVAVLAVPGDQQAKGITVDTAGRAVVSGSTKNASDNFAVGRFTTAGVADTSFDVDGLAYVATFGGSSNSYAYGVVVQPDGKIVAGGTAFNVSANRYDFALARFKSDGTLDGAFNSIGTKTHNAITGNSDVVMDVALQSDGKIVVAGTSNPTVTGDGTQFVVARYNANGQVDNTFGTSGVVSTSFGGGTVAGATGIAVQADGKIVATGKVTVTALIGDENFGIVRLNPANGSYDSSFDGDGKETINFGSTDVPGDIAMETLGGTQKIVVSGSSGSSGDIAVARLNLDGTLDSSFDADGKVVVDASGTGGVERVPGLVIQNVATPYETNIATAAVDTSDNLILTSIDGNSVTPAAQPDFVWVNDDWTISNDTGAAGLSTGDIVYDSGTNTAAVYGVDGFSSIQAAVNAVNTNGSVDVLAGTYTEQVDIGKNIHVFGAGQSNTTLQAPASLVTNFTTSGPNKAVVYIHSNNVQIDNLKIDGMGVGNGNNRIVGIGVNNGGGTIDHVTITRVRNNPLDGVQAGVGILDNNGDSVARSITITNNIINDFQKNGMTLNGAGLTATVTGNTITGAGDTGITAQNGIQLSGGAAGTISNNTISNIAYTGPSFSAAGILLSGASGTTSISGNTITATQVGIYASGSNSNISNNTITGDNAVTDWAVFIDSATSTISGNTIHGADYGIDVYNTTAKAKISNNNLTGNGIGIVAEGEAIVDAGDLSGGNITGLGSSAGNNNLTGYTGINDNYAIYTDNSTTQVKAENNNFGPYVHPNMIENYVFDNNDDATKAAIDFTPAQNQQAGVNTVYVDDNWLGLPLGTDPDGGGPATQIGVDAFYHVYDAVDAVNANGTINVASGTYVEDTDVYKTVSLVGAGASTTTISGAIGGPSVSTVKIDASNIDISGFTITRQGNTVAQWNDPNLNSAGLSIQGQSITGTNIHDNIFVGNRTGIDINNSNGHNIHNNVIDNNRTGLIFRNQTDNLTFTQNAVTNNWTVGILFLDGSGGTNSPVQSAANCSFTNNNISGNWYGQIVDRQSGGSLAAPGTNIKNFSGNWFGSTSPSISNANSAEPGYAAQIPTIYGGSATNPGGQPDILGPASANFDVTPWLGSGTDTSATFGFQGDFSSLYATPQLAQTGATGRIAEAISLVTTGGVVHLTSGTFVENVDVNKTVEISGAGAANSKVVPSFVGANTGGGSLAAGSSNVFLIDANNVQIDNLTVDGDNTALSGGVNVNGANVDARNGIITNHNAGTVNGLSVHDVTVKNIYLRGMYASSGGTFNFTNNTVDNVAADAASIGIFNFGGSGIIQGNTVSRTNDAISANWSTGTQFLNNNITTSLSGVHTDNSSGPDLISGNTVTSGGAGSYGVWSFVPYGTITISNNNVSGVDVGMAALGGAGGTTTFSGNVVHNLNGAGSVGAYITTNTFGFGDFNVSATLSGNNDISGAETGIVVEETGTATATVTITGNNESIHGNTVGIDVTGGTATITGNHIYDNVTGIRLKTGGNATVSNNNFDGGAGNDNTTDVRLDADAGTLSLAGTANSFAGDTYYIDDAATQNVNAVGQSFDVASNFRIEDHMHHRVDTDLALSNGLVTWVGGNLYVTAVGTGPTNDSVIQRGVDSASSGNTVNIEAGTFAQGFDVKNTQPNLTIKGAGEGVTILNDAGVTSALDTGGINIQGQNTTLQGFTLNGAHSNPPRYGIKAYLADGLSIDHVTVTNQFRSGFDINGSNSITLSNLTAQNNGGTGITLTDVNGADVSNITTSGNPWAGITVATFGHFAPLGTSGIVIHGTNSFGEVGADNGGLQLEAGNFNNPASPTAITWSTQLSDGAMVTIQNGDFGYALGGPQALDDGPNHYIRTKFFQTLNQAHNAAAGSPDHYLAHDRFIRTTNGLAQVTNYHVFDVAGEKMSIQAAINDAKADDIVNVHEGTFVENINVNKRLTIDGTGSGTNPATDSILTPAVGGATPVVSITASGASPSNPLLIKDMHIGVSGNHGIEVPAGMSLHDLKLDNVSVIGNDPLDQTEGEVGMWINSTASVNGLEVVNSHFDHLAYGWYFQQDVPNATNVSNVSVTGSSFSYNEAKGLYIEKLSDATFDNSSIVNNGLFTGFFNAAFNAGADINLKGNIAFQNLTFNNMTVTGNAIGAANGAGITIKARGTGSDSSPYNTYPATLSNVQITGGTYSNNQNGIRIGEPGKNNTSPTGVVISGATIANNAVSGVILVGGNTSVTGNTITGGTIAVDVRAGGAGSVIGNTIGGMSDTGIKTAVNGVGVSGNTFTGTMPTDGKWFDAGFVGSTYNTASVLGANTLPTGVTINQALAGDRRIIWANIQGGLNASSNGDTVQIHDTNVSGATVYKESNLSVTKSVTIIGDGRPDVVVAPSIVDGHLDNSFGSASNGFVIGTSGVTIKDLTVDGNANGSLAGTQNFRAAITTDFNAGSFGNITLDNLAIQHIYRKGVSLAVVGNNHVVGDSITNSTFDDIGNAAGLGFEGNFAIAVFQSDATINNVQITHSGAGIGTNYFTTDAYAGKMTISNVSISNMTAAGSNPVLGMDLSGMADGSTVSGNTIDMTGGNNNDVGIVVQYAATGANVSVTGNNITTGAGDTGIMLYADADAAHPVLVSGNTLSGTGSNKGILATIDGSFFGESPNVGTTRATLSNNNVSGYATGIEVNGANASAPITGNTLSNNTTGIRVTSSGSPVNISNNNLTANTTGVVVSSVAVLNYTNNTVTGSTSGGSLSSIGTINYTTSGANDTFALTNTAMSDNANDAISYSGVTTLNVFVLGGNDVVTVSGAAAGLTTWVDGGIGNDTLNWEGTGGNDSIRFATAPIVGPAMTSTESAYYFGGAQRVNMAGMETRRVRGLGGDDSIVYDRLGGSVATGFVIEAGDGNDSVTGGLGNDTITGGIGNDRLDGANGNDNIDGQDGDDQVYGGIGDDTLTGGTGENQLYGQNGNDTIFCQNGILDFVDGGAGFDQAHADGIDLLSSIETLF